MNDILTLFLAFRSCRSGIFSYNNQYKFYFRRRAHPQYLSRPYVVIQALASYKVNSPLGVLE